MTRMVQRSARARSRRNRQRILALLGIVGVAGIGGASAVACGFDGEGTRAASPPEPDATVEASLPPTGDSSIPPDPNDAGTDANGTVACPATTRGPGLLRVGDGGFCIDETEVTMAQYAAFLADLDAGPGIDAGSRCPGPNVLEPDPIGTDPADAAALPARNVDWCAANAFCAWAGKRLCGGSDLAVDASASEWSIACAGEAGQAYPYGPSHVGGTCNDELTNLAEPVASRAGCVGSVPGLFDMSGNVAEWTNECDNGEPGTCQVAGGYFDSQDASSCLDRLGYAVPTKGPGIGIRCCADVVDQP